MAATQGIKLDDQTQDRLKVLAEKRHRSPHWLMKDAINRYLEAEEQYEQEKSDDMERWERYQLTGKAIEGAVAEEWLKDLAKGKKTPRPE
jgi:predicted transcriptional regulator